MSTIEVTHLRPVGHNKLRGVVDFRYHDLVVRDAPLHVRAGRAWISLPSRPRTTRERTLVLSDDGRVMYDALLTWTTLDAAEEMQAALLALVRERFPHLVRDVVA